VGNDVGNIVERRQELFAGGDRQNADERRTAARKPDLWEDPAWLRSFE
jgi:hypothetical protein